MLICSSGAPAVAALVCFLPHGLASALMRIFYLFPLKNALIAIVLGLTLLLCRSIALLFPLTSFVFGM